MSKTKIVETFTGQSVLDLGTKLRNCAKLEFRKSGIRQFFAKMTFANDCANCCFFRAKLMCKERTILRFVPQKLTVLRMETLHLLNANRYIQVSYHFGFRVKTSTNHLLFFLVCLIPIISFKFSRHLIFIFYKIFFFVFQGESIF